MGDKRIYELVNHVKCGALYLKVFVQINEGTPYWYVFPNRGLDGDVSSLKEMLLYLVPDGYIKGKNDKLASLDPFTGKLYLQKKDDNSLLTVVYTDKYDSKTDSYTFPTCPKCKKPMHLKKPSDFSTKGNIPFYYLTKAQFEMQPPRSDFINQGKKFSCFLIHVRTQQNLLEIFRNPLTQMHLDKLYSLPRCFLKRTGRNIHYKSYILHFSMCVYEIVFHFLLAIVK